MSAHSQAVQCATTRIVIDSYEKQIKSLEQRLRHAEEEVHNLRKIVNTFETYHENAYHEDRRRWIRERSSA